MADIRLTTRRELGVEPPSPIPGNPDVWFGEQTNDLQFNNLKDFETISGIEKLKQDINKILLTEQGKNTNFPLYGTNLQVLIGQKFNFEYLKAKIRDEVVGALQVLQYLNQDNPDLDEKPEILQTLQVTQQGSDGLLIQLSVITESGKSIATSVVFPITVS